jgi:hypothetical protein
MAAQESRHPLASGREGDEGPARSADALEELPDDVLTGRHRAAGLLQLAGLFFRGGDEVLQALVGRVGAHHHERRLDHHAGDRRHLLEAGLGFGLHEWIGQPDVGEDAEHMRIALLAEDVVRRRRAAAARLVGDLDADRRQLLLLDHADERPAEHVVAGSRPAMDDKLDRAGRLELRAGGRGERRKHNQCSSHEHVSIHQLPPGS